MARIEVKTTILQQPVNNSTFGYKIGSPSGAVTFYDSDGNPVNEIKKTFKTKETYNLLRFGSEKNGVMSPQFKLKGFNGEVKDFVIIPERGSRPRLIAIIGAFTTFNNGGTTVQTNKFCILEYPETGFGAGIFTFYHSQNYMFEISAVLNTIDYDELADELCIGGDIAQVYETPSILNMVPNLYFFKVDTKGINFIKNEQMLSNGTIDNIVNCVKYRNNNELVACGTFNNFLGKIWGKIGVVSSAGNPVASFDMGGGTNGNITRFDVTDSGDIYIIGTFSVFDGQYRRQMAKLSSNGALQPFNSTGSFTGGTPKDIKVVKVLVNNNLVDRVYVGGDFTGYAGQNRGGLIVLDSSDSYVDSFNIMDKGISLLEVNRLDVDYRSIGISTSIGKVYVAGTTTEYPGARGFVVDANSGTLRSELYVNNTVNKYSFDGNDTFFGGTFTQFNNTSEVLGNHEILSSSNNATTANNTRLNLQANSINSESIYSRNLNVVTHDYYFFDGEPTVYAINEIPNFVEIEVNYYDGGGLPTQHSLNTALLLLRSDFIYKSKSGNYTSTKFNLKTYSGDIDDVDSGDSLTIEKPRLSLQDNTWINVSPLVDATDLSVNRTLLNSYFTSTFRLSPTKQGKFAQISANNFIGNDPVSDSSQKAIVLDGFKDKNVDKIFLPALCINGNYREIKEGSSIKIPINMFKVDKVIVRGLNGTVLEVISLPSEPTYVGDKSILDGIVNYFKVSYDDYSSKNLTLHFLDKDDVDLETVKIKKVPVQCLTGKSDVIFVNRYGYLEHTQMVGLKKESFRTEADEYQISTRDINGNINTIAHKNKIFSKGGEQTYSLNTGVVNDKMNKVYEDLVFAESIWLRIEGDYIPVTLKDTNFREKYTLENSPVEYTFNFKESNNKVRNDI